MITTIGWFVGANIDEKHPLLLTHQNSSGKILEGPKEFTPPIIPRDPYVLFPASCHWDGEDGFWFLERNAGIMWHMDKDANFLEHFPHPAPPTEQFVFATATDFRPERGVFYFTTDSAGENRVTRLVETTLEGILTGYEIPLEGTQLSSIKATFVEGSELKVFGSRSGLPALVTCKAFSAGPAVENLAIELRNRRPRLTWRVAGGAADRIVIERDREVIAELGGGEGSYLDEGASEGFRHVYVVRAQSGGTAGPHAAASVYVPPPERRFVRGDVNRSGKINIADPIYILAYLFSGGPPPPCMDAADLNDDGKIQINDPIYLLGWLFAHGPEPAPPFPEEDFDPTPDDLPCAFP